jgi:site-specific recombinase XerD
MAESKRVAANKGKRFPAEVLTSDEVLALLSKCSSRAPTGQRNAALIVLLWRAGLRCSEALDLHIKDIDAKAHTVRVLNGKGRRARTVGLDATSFAVIARWMDTRKALGINGRSTLLCTLKGGKLDASYVRTMLPRLAARAGIDKRVHPHALRHTHAVELLREGVPVTVISRQLGHSSIATTAVYLDHLEPADVIDAIQAREWPVEAIKLSRSQKWPVLRNVPTT